jgi:hypothetical protein
MKQLGNLGVIKPALRLAKPLACIVKTKVTNHKRLKFRQKK